MFISYARPERAHCNAIAEQIRAAGFSVWFDTELESGATFPTTIEAEIGKARAVVVLWSAKATESRWILAEATKALEANKLVAVFLDSEVPLPVPFNVIHTINLGQEGGWQELIAAIVGKGDSDQPLRPQPASFAATKSRGRFAHPGIFLGLGRPTVNVAVFSHEGRYLATGSHDRTAILWDWASRRRLATFVGAGDWVFDIAFSQRDSEIVIASGKGLAWYDVEARKRLRVVKTKFDYTQRCIFSSDFRRLLTCGFGFSWLDASSGKELRSGRVGLERVRAFALSPDDSTVALLTASGVRLVDANTFQFRDRKAHLQTVEATALCFGPENRNLYIGNEDGHIGVWDYRSGTLLRTLKQENFATSPWHAQRGMRVRGLVASPDGALLLAIYSTAAGGYMAVWDLAAEAPAATINEVIPFLSRPAFHPTGHAIAASDDSDTIRVWTIEKN